MNIFVVVALAMCLMVILVRKHIPIGPALLAAGAVIWLLIEPRFDILVNSAVKMATKVQTYDLLGALFFVVCLEIQLNKSGCLKGMVRYLIQKIPSLRFTMAIMPAFLGLLPSLGGARFSAPIVSSLSTNQGVSCDRLTAINFWFRHVFECTSPLVPGMILICALAGVSIGDMIAQVGWIVFPTFIFGWIFLVMPMRLRHPKGNVADTDDTPASINDVILCFLPVIMALTLIIVFSLRASVAMGIVSLCLFVGLYLLGRGVSFRDVYIGAIEWRLIRDICCILLFIQILTQTGALMMIVEGFKAAPVPVPVSVAMSSFFIGMLIGTSQGPCAIMTPIVMALTGFETLDLVGIVAIFSFMGIMITPTHLCLIVSVDFFKSDLFKVLHMCFWCTTALTAFLSAIIYFCWF